MSFLNCKDLYNNINQKRDRFIILKCSNIFVFLFFISIILIGCSDKSTEPERDSGTQFPAVGVYEGEYWPTEDWRNCAPEEVGMDSALLMKAYDFAAQSDMETYSILIAKDGYIVGEAYFNGISVNSIIQGYSFAKSFTSAVMGIAIAKGYIQRHEALSQEIHTLDAEL